MHGLSGGVSASRVVNKNYNVRQQRAAVSG